MNMLKTFFLCLSLAAVPLLSIANPGEGTFMVKSISDERIVAVATYQVDGAAMLSGTPVRLAVGVANMVSGEAILLQPYTISLPAGTPELIIGNNRTGRLKASFDSNISELKIRFSLRVEDFTRGIVNYQPPEDILDFPAILGGQLPEDQFRVVFLTDLSDVSSENQAVASTGVITIYHSFGDGQPPIIQEQ